MCVTLVAEGDCQWSVNIPFCGGGGLPAPVIDSTNKLVYVSCSQGYFLPLGEKHLSEIQSGGANFWAYTFDGQLAWSVSFLSLQMSSQDSDFCPQQIKGLITTLLPSPAIREMDSVVFIATSPTEVQAWSPDGKLVGKVAVPYQVAKNSMPAFIIAGSASVVVVTLDFLPDSLSTPVYRITALPISF